MNLLQITQVVPVRNKTNVPEIIVTPTKGMLRINSKAGIILGASKGHGVAHFSTESTIMGLLADKKVTDIGGGQYQDADGNILTVQHFIANLQNEDNGATSVLAVTGKNEGIGAQLQFTNNTMWGALNGSTKDLKVYELVTPGFQHVIGDKEVTLYELKYATTRPKSEKGLSKEVDVIEEVITNDTNNTTDVVEEEVKANPFNKKKK